MQYDFIGIRDQKINGVKNPMVTIVGTISKTDFKFKVLADDKRIKHKLDMVNKKGDFVLFAPIDNKTKKVTVFVITKEGEQVISTLKNSLLRRSKVKAKDILKSVKEKLSRLWVWLKFFFKTIGKGIKLAWREHHFLIPIALWKKYFKALKEKFKNTPGNSIFYNPFNVCEYNMWLKENEKFNKAKKLDYKPLISVVIPVYNIGKILLKECLDSILVQTYKNFEICLADDCSTNKETIETLKEYEKKNKKIRVVYRTENGHISKATNSAINIAKGDFIAFMDDDDVLSPHAFYEVVNALNKNKKLDLIYSDEDKINTNGLRCDPHFKPDWSPDTMLSMNYISHLTVVRKELVDSVGGLAVGFEGAQDYDLYLKITEKTNNIYHIPKILYHWRMVEGSTSMSADSKSYAKDNGRRALESALKRRKLDGSVIKDDVSGYYQIKYNLKKEPLISIIIPTKDYATTLDVCLKSLYKKTTYKNFEVIVVNNNSVENETFKLFEKYKKQYSNFSVIEANFEFNYSKINNMAVKKAKGEFICLLNNDTEIITPEWLDILVGYASQEHVGTVGPKLFYPDNTVQHAGVIMGLGGVASHAYIGAGRKDPGMYGRLRVPYNYACVTAACLVVSKSKYLEVGGLEERLKVAYNDVDFNLKLLNRGYYNVFVPQVELYHYESKSRGLDNTSKKLKRFNIEQDFMYNKWPKIIKSDPFYNDNFSKKGWFMLFKEEVKHEKPKKRN